MAIARCACAFRSQMLIDSVDKWAVNCGQEHTPFYLQRPQPPPNLLNSSNTQHWPDTPSSSFFLSFLAMSVALPSDLPCPLFCHTLLDCSPAPIGVVCAKQQQQQHKLIPQLLCAFCRIALFLYDYIPAAVQVRA